jgi:hypothetical protein
MMTALKIVRNCIFVSAIFCWGISVIAALVSQGHVLKTKAEAGQYLLYLRVGREPATWVETTALRYWFETSLDVAFMGSAFSVVAWGAAYYLWREWRRSQGTWEGFD